MIANHLKTALRILKRYRSFSLISLLGLATGITCSALLLLFLLNEMSYDRFHSYKDRIYRISTVEINEGEQSNSADSPPPLAELIRSEFGHVGEAVRINSRGETAVSRPGASFLAEGFYAEPAFLQIFSFPLVEGDPETALREADAVVISEALARKLFDSEQAVGEEIRIRDERFRVTGVLENVPRNSHLQFDYLTSWSSYEKRIGENRSTFLEDWYYGSTHTYLLLESNVSPAQLEDRLTEASNARIDRTGFEIEYKLQPLTDIYLHSNLDFEIGPTGSMAMIWILAALLILILVIVAINFINLATAFIRPRLKEIGVRKTLGARPSDIRNQMLSETVLLSMTALVIAIPVLEWAEPWFVKAIGVELAVGLYDPRILLGYLVLALVIGLLAGWYPAIYAGRRDPFALQWLRSGGGRVRKALVVFQFGITALLLMSTLGIEQQLSYMTESDKGYDAEKVLLLRNRAPGTLAEHFDSFTRELESHPLVEKVSASTGAGPIGGNRGTLTVQGREHAVEWMGVDTEFLALYDISMSAGRNFSTERSTDYRQGIILNEAAVRAMGLESPLDAEITMSPLRRTGRVIGVVEDFHFDSFHNTIRPLALVMMSPRGTSYLSVKVLGDWNSSVLAHLEKTWEQFVPGYPLEYRFLQERLGSLYEKERQYATVTGFASILAIVLSSMGLFGLVVFSVNRRLKEIGIRKVLGADLHDIIFMLTREYFMLAMTGIAAAIPLIYFGLMLWLRQFAYRAEPGPGIFLRSAAIILLIALLTVGWKAVQAGRGNPVTSLRSE